MTRVGTFRHLDQNAYICYQCTLEAHIKSKEKGTPNHGGKSPSLEHEILWQLILNKHKCTV